MADPPGAMEVDAAPSTNSAQDQSLQLELEQVRAASTRQQLESEQALHDLGIQLSALEAQYNVEKQKATEAAATAEQERQKAAALEQQLDALKRSGDEQAKSSEQRRREKEEHEKEKRELLQVVERAQQDNQQLQGERRCLSRLGSPCSAG